MSSYSECFDNLEKCAKSKGYLTYDDILDAADSFDVSVIEVDKLSEQLLLNGVIISDEPPLDDNQEYFDYSRVDYDQIYSEIISIDPGLENLVKQISEYPAPQKGEIAELYAQMEYYKFKGIQARKAREKLISIYLRIVLKSALSLSNQNNYELSDAISAGFIGLIYAVDKYNAKQNESIHFGSYVNQFIWSTIIRECQPKWIHRIPTHIMDKLLIIINMYKDYYGLSYELEMPDDYFLIECSKHLEEPKEKVKSYFNLILKEQQWLSIEEYAENEDENNAFLSVEYEYSWEDEIYRYQIVPVLHKALETLPPKQLRVIKLRYGFDGKNPMTLEEVGKMFNLTRERIRQIECKVLRRLKICNSSKILLNEILDYE